MAGKQMNEETDRRTEIPTHRCINKADKQTDRME
jgi:hypothetical protein